MERLRDGEVEMLGLLYERYGGIVRAALHREAPEMSPAVLDELTQEVFLAANDAVERYSDRDRLGAWLYGIAYRTGRFWRRKRAVRRRLLLERKDERIGLGSQPRGDPARDLGLKRAVREALFRLPEELRRVLVLHAVEGFSGEEIATALGIKHQTVRTRLHRARRTLLADARQENWRELLAEDGSER